MKINIDSDMLSVIIFLVVTVVMVFVERGLI